ncbi:hypothetical protein BW731_00045 [Vagococcus martis]|uniref:Lipoprotein n=1 Tax=Vagococcus martis TaxID=1768210 RepID=A0A1V4DEG6_9ENTE|nr:hypothetical protein [Vagococcus martis]OPF86696.1 hypothetical protein BW731_00045 [Vagococcus martis]
MKNIAKFIGFVGICCVTVVMTGCSINKNEVKSAQITSVLNNKETLQENALYHFDNGKLEVNLTFSPFENPNTNPSDSEYDKKLEETIKNLNKEFPNDTIKKENFNNKVEKSFKNVTVSVDNEKKKVTISGKDITKEFTMSESNENRLTDDLGNEYELTYSK